MLKNIFSVIVYCPDGWYSSQGVCMKAFESSSEVSYAQAAASCQSMGSDIAQPNNEIDSQTLADVLTNFTTNMTTTKFWIGEKFRSKFKPLTFLSLNYLT